MEGAVSAVPGSSHNFRQNPRLGYSRHKKVTSADLSSNINPLCSDTSFLCSKIQENQASLGLETNTHSQFDAIFSRNRKEVNSRSYFFLSIRSELMLHPGQVHLTIPLIKLPKV